MAAILVGEGIVGHNSESRPPKDHSTIFCLVQIDPVVLEELIKMQKGNDRRTTDAQW